MEEMLRAVDGSWQKSMVAPRKLILKSFQSPGGIVMLTAAAALSSSHQSAQKVVTIAQLDCNLSKYRAERKRIVFTNGCFDLLHVGHVTYLQEAARLGDVLVVAVNSDAAVKRLKGKSRPVNSQSDRAAMLAVLGCVNHELLFDDDTPHVLLHRLRPDVLVEGGTYTEQEVVGREIVNAY